MYEAHCQLRSATPYSQSKYYAPFVPKLEKERPDDYERRTWKHHLHLTPEGKIFIPQAAFKFALDRAAKLLRMAIPGKGKSEFGKHFLAGCMVLDPLVLPLGPDDVEGEWIHANADGKRGSGTRVLRCFPRIDSWSGALVFHVLDETITPDVFRTHLIEAGRLVGIGRYRPENGGHFGRFSLDDLQIVRENQEGGSHADRAVA